MAAKIARVRIINRRTSHARTVDPAQFGAYHARLAENNRLTVTGLQGRVVLRQNGVLAAKWEPQADETILLVLREEPEDDPVVLHAFRTRVGGPWDTEDAHASATVSPNGNFIAVETKLPNAAIAVLATGRIVQEYDVATNLGTVPDNVVWSDDSKTLTVTTPDQVLTWSIGKKMFTKSSAK